MKTLWTLAIAVVILNSASAPAQVKTATELNAGPAGAVDSDGNLQRALGNHSSITYWGSWVNLDNVRKSFLKVKGPEKSDELSTVYEAAKPAASFERHTHQSDHFRDTCVLLFNGDCVRCLGAQGPDHGRADVYLDGELSMKLRIRIPGWASSPVAVQINGESVLRGEPGTYVTLDRVWQDGDRITFELPMKFRTEKYRGLDQHPEHDRYALLYGPLLMALVGEDDLEVEADELPSHLIPIDGKPLHFSVAGQEGVYFKPYWQIDQEVFTCFPTLR